MIGLFASQLFAVLVAALLFGTPGWALSRLMQLHLRMPTVAMPAAWFTLGLGVWTLVLLPALALGLSISVTVGIHVALTFVLVVWSRLRDRRGHAKRGTSDGFSGWTFAVIVLATLAALALRTRVAFDSLFHLGMIRRLAQFDSPTFDNLDRVVGSGVNPAYALPTWQAAMAAVTAVTGLDAATVLESMAVLGVLLAACAAGALGRVVTGTVYGEIAGAAAYAWLRVFYPRRELEGDGVAYASLPGNIALDVLLPMALVAAVLLMAPKVPLRRNVSVLVVGMVAVALLVVLHANYVVYLAIIALGTGLWMLAAEPWRREVVRRLGAVAGLLAVPGLVALAVLLPVLMLLEHFGAPLESRIDYHLIEFAGADLVRPGHMYDWFAVAGLFGVLILPWAAWRARGVARALIGGGSLMLLAFALAPPLVDLLGSSGSLTLSLRLPRPFGVLLVAAAAIAVPDLIRRSVDLGSRAAVARGPVVGWIVKLAPLAAIAALSAVYGYPLVRREPPQYGWDWPTWFALAGLLAVFVLAIRERIRDRRTTAPVTSLPPLDGEDAAHSGSLEVHSGGAARPVRRVRADDDVFGIAPTPRMVGLGLLAIAITMLPSGAMSMRRAAWQSRELVAAYRADDLRCYEGVQAALRELPAGSVLLSDPVTAYGAQALAPVRIAGDFKVWNGSTDTGRIERRLQLLRATFDSQQGERAGAGLARMSADLDARYVLVSDGPVEPPLGSDLGSYDAQGLRDVLESGEIGARRLASGPGRFPSDVDEDERAACDLSLWELNGSERDLQLERDEHHAPDT